jgi:hypothetical protein
VCKKGVFWGKLSIFKAEKIFFDAEGVFWQDATPATGNWLAGRV